LALLDETDSGLDIDALRIVSEGVNKLRSKQNAIVLVTHYQRLLDYIKPDFVHVLANGKIIQDGKFKNVWIQPAAGDAGGALGAALSIWHSHLSNKREVKLNQGLDKMQGSYLGPSYNNIDIEKVLLKYEANYELLSTEEMINFAAQILSEKKAIGWFQGRMEFGPRALGARSILADPRDDNMQKNLNLKIKFRESFRPFAPAILDHKAEEWFDIKSDSPYMLLVAQVKKNKILNYNENYKKNLSGFDLLNLKRSVVPAITHVDYSARVQTVSELTNKKFYDLISKFYKITNCPMLVNTSFNIRGEPIVNTPEDALKCFLGTGLDYLIIENYILDKKKQKRKLNFNYQNSYELD
jgi:carbamoyltransferase